MVTNTLNRWGVRLGTLALSAVAAACVVFWGLKLASRQVAQAAPAMAPSAVSVDGQAMARLLGDTGARAATPVGASPGAEAVKYHLIGVVAGTHSGQGAALIAVGGKPAKPFRVGAEVDAGLVLQSVNRREAKLGTEVAGPVSMTLQIPLKP